MSFRFSESGVCGIARQRFPDGMAEAMGGRWAMREGSRAENGRNDRQENRGAAPPRPHRKARCGEVKQISSVARLSGTQKNTSPRCRLSLKRLLADYKLCGRIIATERGRSTFICGLIGFRNDMDGDAFSGAGLLPMIPSMPNACFPHRRHRFVAISVPGSGEDRQAQGRTMGGRDGTRTGT